MTGTPLAAPPPAQASDEPMRELPESWRNSDISWICHHLKENTIFDVDRLQREWNEMKALAIQAAVTPRATADVEKLPPLPSTHLIGQGKFGPIYGYDDRQMQEYARAALKAQPAPTEAQGEPVMWFEAEASAKGQPLRHVIGSMLYSTRMHTTKPEVLNNALWPLYEHPALGEDSARLDALADEVETMESEHGRESFGKQSDFAHYAEGHEDARKAAAARIREFCDAIDRAQASAETGGVKS